MALFSGNIDDLRTLYTNQLRHLLSTEEQIMDALPKMVDSATDMQLKNALQTHLQETKVHRQRVNEILKNLTCDDNNSKSCSVTDELIDTGETVVKSARTRPSAMPRSLPLRRKSNTLKLLLMVLLVTGRTF